MSPALTGSAVSFSAGTKTISLVAPAAKLIQEDDNGDLSVTRNLAVGGYVAAASARAAAFYFDLSATLPFGYQVAGYTVVYDGSARAALHMGGTGDPTNYYRNTTHYFQSVAGGANFAIMNSTGLAVSGVVDASGSLKVNGHTLASHGAGFNILYEAAGAPSLLLNAGSTYYEADSHQFRKSDHSTVLATLGASACQFGTSVAVVGDSFRTQANAYSRYYWESTGNVPGIRKWQMYCGVSGEITLATLNDAENAIGGGVIFFNGGSSYAFTPVTDNVNTLGGGSLRWSVVYATTGTINTSGRAAKMFIGEATDAEKRAAARIKARGPRRYKLVDAVNEKGEEKARWHFGYVAEDVRDDLAAEGLDPWAYAFMCADPVTKTEAYFEKMTRPKTRKISIEESVVEVIDGLPVMVRKQIEREQPAGKYVPVLDESGNPVMEKAGEEPTGETLPVIGDDGKPVMVPTIASEDGKPIVVFEAAVRDVMRDMTKPLMHFVQELEEYDEPRTRQVDIGEVRLGLRYSELEAFLRCVD